MVDITISWVGAEIRVDPDPCRVSVDEDIHWKCAGASSLRITPKGPPIGFDVHGSGSAPTGAFVKGRAKSKDALAGAPRPCHTKYDVAVQTKEGVTLTLDPTIIINH